jgi:hypothetical protein
MLRHVEVGAPVLRIDVAAHVMAGDDVVVAEAGQHVGPAHLDDNRRAGWVDAQDPAGLRCGLPVKGFGEIRRHRRHRRRRWVGGGGAQARNRLARPAIRQRRCSGTTNTFAFFSRHQT